MGQTDAMIMLGQLYAKGKQVPKNTKISAEWFKIAADLGDGYAQLITGDNYAEGIGFRKDAKTALEYYMKSAAHGNTIACYNIGTAYALGRGVEKNNELSFEWLNRAAEDNFMKAMFSVAEAYSKGQQVVNQHDDEDVRTPRKRLSSTRNLQTMGSENPNTMSHTPTSRVLEPIKMINSRSSGSARVPRLETFSANTTLDTATPTESEPSPMRRRRSFGIRVRQSKDMSSQERS